MILAHASFFSGVGGMDLGLERAGWTTVSFSEIDPYASAVLAHHWPEVPNLGDITRVRDAECGQDDRFPGDVQQSVDEVRQSSRPADGREPDGGHDWRDAVLWSGGFPCQDLSVAGKRRGMGEGTRSGLAYTFLDLVELYRPPAILLENVPGLLSSHAGKDFGTLLRSLVELGYGVSWRVLDARHFGVPQRRRRVFILALRHGPDDPDGHLAAERAAQVLAVGTRCRRHPATGGAEGSGPPDEPRDGAEVVGSLAAGGMDKHATQNVAAGHYIASRPVPGGDDDVVGTLPASLGKGVGHNRDGFIAPDYTTAIHTSIGRRSGPAGDEVRNLVVGTLDTSDGREGRDDPARYVVQEFGLPREHALESGREGSAVGRDEPRLSDGGGAAPDARGVRAPDVVSAGMDDRPELEAFGVSSFGQYDNPLAQLRASGGDVGGEDDLLPNGLDSHRYRCCGNGVVSNVAEWIALRLAAYFRGELENAA